MNVVYRDYIHINSVHTPNVYIIDIVQTQFYNEKYLIYMCNTKINGT